MTVDRSRLPIRVLDHGYVVLVDSMGTDERVIEAARMSTGRGFISWEPYERCKVCGCPWRINQPTKEQPHGSLSVMEGFKCEPCCDNPPTMDVEKFPRGDLGLLDRLYRSGHSTPFEMAELAIEVQAPLFVFREWHRHRTQSYSEFSARYSVMPKLHYLPEIDRVKKQSKVNRQGGEESIDVETAISFLEEVNADQNLLYNQYDSAIKKGIANELARINTPVSRYSKMQAKTDLRNWLGFLKLRMAPEAQWEIRQYANAVAEIIKSIWPRTWALFEEYDLGGVRLSKTERTQLMWVLRDFSGSSEEIKKLIARIDPK